jgi:hypothetical protein
MSVLVLVPPLVMVCGPTLKELGWFSRGSEGTGTTPALSILPSTVPVLVRHWTRSAV